MRLLVLGGTRFVGRHIVESALRRGHELTLFNRGVTAPGLFPEAEHVRGERDSDLGSLSGRSFDAVVDVSAYTPEAVEGVLGRLRGFGRYLFISTVSVYANKDAPVLTEDSPVRSTLEGPNGYGYLKAAAERVLLDSVGDAATVIRPGVVAGPYDPTDRFTYWVLRGDRMGEILAPGSPEHPVQYIDARDLAAFVLHCAEQDLPGVFNVVTTTTMGRLIETCMRVAGSDAIVRYAPEEFLLEHGCDLWRDFPLYVPDDHPAFRSVSSARAEAAGLSPRSLADTVSDILQWVRGEGRVLASVGIDPTRERQLLAELRSRQP